MGSGGLIAMKVRRDKKQHVSSKLKFEALK